MKKLVIFGGGDSARTLHAYLTQDSDREVVAFTAQDAGPGKDRLLGLDLVPFEDVERRFPPAHHSMIIAISYGKLNASRANIFMECKRKGYELDRYVSSSARNWGTLGANCVMLDYSATQPYSRIGDDVVLCVGSIIGHDVEVGDHCFIGPNAVISGRARVGPSCFIGANAVLRDGVRMGANCVVGAGAVILRDARDGEVILAPGSRSMAIDARALGPFMGMGNPTAARRN